MKLVRDKIPDLYPEHEYRQAHHAEEVTWLLARKVVEEASEVRRAVRRHQESGDLKEVVEELADLHEVVCALMEDLGITLEELAQARVSKGLAKGLFVDRWVLEDKQ